MIAAVVALAAALTATDSATDMTFTLSGRTLTASIGANTPAKTKARLNGKTVAFSCARMQGRMTGTHALKVWPVGAQTVRATLPKTLANPDACGVETRGGRDIAFAYFD